VLKTGMQTLIKGGSVIKVNLEACIPGSLFNVRRTVGRFPVLAVRRYLLGFNTPGGRSTGTARIRAPAGV
jgi:hypothetical protein